MDLKYLYQSDDGIHWLQKEHNLAISSLGFSNIPNGNHTFLVVRNGGMAYSFDGENFLPIYTLGEFKNQFESFAFLNHGMPHLFGGNGLFTTKNIITYLNTKTKNWELVPNFSEDENSPRPRFAAVGQVDKNILYIGMGFSEKSISETDKKNIPLFDFWQFDFNTKKWSKIGDYKQELGAISSGDIQEYVYSFSNINHQPTLLGKTSFYTLDIKNNQLIRYENPELPLYRLDYKHFTYNPYTKSFFYLSKDINQSFIPKVVPEKVLMGNRRSVSKLYIPVDSYINQWYEAFFLVALCLLLILLYVLFKRKKRNVPYSCTYDLLAREMEIIHQELTAEEKNLLLKIFNQYPEKISFGELFDSFDAKLSHDTLKKKLKQTLDSIDDKIRKKFQLNASIFEIIKSEDDKRVKKVGIIQD